MVVVVKKRGGRKRKNAVRHPSGKIRQARSAEREADVTSVARAARRRVHGVSKSDATRPEAGDMIGRLMLSGEISAAQHAAATAYAELRAAYDRAMGARRMRTASDLHPGRAAVVAETDGDAAWATRKRLEYERVRRALVGCPDPLALMVVEAIVIEGREMWDYIGTLRLALNAVGQVLAPGGGGARSDDPSRR